MRIHLVVGNVVAQVIAAIINTKECARPGCQSKTHRIAQA
jgi:hypothetical protein